jgi:hypothetical protein
MAEDGLTMSWRRLDGEVEVANVGGKDFRWGVVAAAAEGDSELALNYPEDNNNNHSISLI